MRLAIFSDIHGNVRALDACLEDLEAQGGAELIVGAGDYCMDGPRPRQVLERLEALGAQCVRGNTDRYIAELDASVLDDEDRAAIEWYRDQLGPAWTEWLGALPFAREFGGGDVRLLVVHANPKCDDEHVWPDAFDDTLEHYFSGVEHQAVAFGHLHLPYVRLWRGKLLINVASVGIPKDGDPRASYSIVTLRSGGFQVKQRRVPFDVDRVERELKKSGLPDTKRLITVLRRHRYKQLQQSIP